MRTRLLFLFTSFFLLTQPLCAAEAVPSEEAFRQQFNAIVDGCHCNCPTNLKLRRSFRTYIAPVFMYGGAVASLGAFLLSLVAYDKLDQLEMQQFNIQEYAKATRRIMTPEQKRVTEQSLIRFGEMLTKQKKKIRWCKKAAFWCFLISIMTWVLSRCGDANGWWPADTHSQVAQLIELVGNRENNTWGIIIRSRPITVPYSEIIEVQRDGTCTFHSIAAQLQENKTGDNLRQEAGNLIEQQCKKGYLHPDNNDIYQSIECAVRILEGIDESVVVNRKTIIATYVDHVKNQNLWGGPVEMIALARKYNLTIFSFDACQSSWLPFDRKYKFANVYGTGSKKVVLLRDGNHYEGWRNPSLSKS